MAGSLAGSNVTVTSSFDGGTAQTLHVTVGTPETQGASKEVVFNDFSWMSANDYIDFYYDGTYNRLRVFLDSTHNFNAADDINLSVQLAPGWNFDPSATALIIASDVFVNGSLNGANDTLSFDLTGLDQIGPDPLTGIAEFSFLATSTPEPGTFCLLGLSGAAALFVRKRRKA